MKTTKDFKVGQAVRYVPVHAHGDANHENCENGIVTSINDEYVFVLYNLEGSTSQATNPDNLI